MGGAKGARNDGLEVNQTFPNGASAGIAQLLNQHGVVVLGRGFA